MTKKFGDRIRKSKKNDKKWTAGMTGKKGRRGTNRDLGAKFSVEKKNEMVVGPGSPG